MLIKRYFDDYKRFELNQPEMSLSRAFFYVLFDSIFFGLKYGFLVGFIYLFFIVFQGSILNIMFTDICPLIQ